MSDEQDRGIGMGLFAGIAVVVLLLLLGGACVFGIRSFQMVNMERQRAIAAHQEAEAARRYAEEARQAAEAARIAEQNSRTKSADPAKPDTEKDRPSDPTP